MSDCPEVQVLRDFASYFPLPDDYLVIDIETSGFSSDKDVIIEAGWAVVRARKVVHYTGLLLDWSKVPGVDTGRIQSQLAQQATAYQQKGRPHYFPWERLQAEGEDPREVLQAYMTLLRDYMQRPYPALVGHGAWRFDRQFIDKSLQRYLPDAYVPWVPNCVLDTGLIEKSLYLGTYPWAGDTLDLWSDRTNRAYLRQKWNLPEHCEQKYKLSSRTGLDPALSHTAGADCVMTHALLETYREMLEASCSP